MVSLPAPDDVDDTSPYGAMWRASRGEPVPAAGLHHLRPTGVMGTLLQMPLTEILQTLDFGKKTARVDVYFVAMRGTVHVHDGQIVRAEGFTADADFHEGEAAVIELCRSKDGFFRIEYVKETIDRNVQRPTTFVLLETLRILDEAAAGGAPGGDDDGDDGDDGDGWGPMAARIDEGARQEARSDDDLDVDLDGGTGAHALPTVQHPRYRIGLPVEVEDDDRTAELHCEDISLGGVFLRTVAPPALGTVVRLRLPTPQGPLALTGRVVHILDEQQAAKVSREAGMGVDFEGLAPEASQQLRRLIDKMAAGPLRAGAGSSDKVQSLTAESEFLVAAGDLKGAQRVLLEAHQLAPQDDDVRRRLRHVDEAIDAAQAHAFLEQAMRGGPQAVDFARRATQLRPVRDVLLRSLAVFARAGAHDEVADVAEQLLEIDPQDEGALRTLLDANVALKRWGDALHTVEALLQKHPDDAQLKALAAKVAPMVKRR